MNCNLIDDIEDDIISSSSSSTSSSTSTSPSDHRHSTSRKLDNSNHNLSIEIGKNHFEAAAVVPSGLNLLVAAALDAQDNRKLFRRQESPSTIEQILIVDDSQPNSTDDEISYSTNVSTEKVRRRRRKSQISDISKDESYWEKRRRNNEAAKRSREKRRVNDMAMEARLMELSRENNLLKNELDTVKKRPSIISTPTPNPTPIATPQLLLPSNQTDVLPSNRSEISARSPHHPHHVHHPSLTSAAHFVSLQQVASRSPFLPAMVNPLLAGMIPPAVLLQAIAQQQQQQQRLASTSPPISLKRFNPQNELGSILHSAPTPTIQFQQSAAPSILTAALSAPPTSTVSPPPTASSFSDGKQYLRYKLLERQLQQQNNQITPPPLPPSGLNLGTTTTISNGQKSRSSSISNQQPQQPPAKRQRTSISTSKSISDLIRNETTSNNSLSLKECLSSLAVSLISPNPNSTNSNGEKIHDSSSSPSTISHRTSIHLSPILIDEHPNLEDRLIGDLLRARTHSDSSQSSAGISSHGSSTSATSVSIVNGGGSNSNGRLSPGALMEMEFRHSLNSERRRDSNNSDSGMASDQGGDRRSPGGTISNGGGKRYRSDHERYMERRRRNNEAAKRCRANRRAMFEYRYQRAQELENENQRLKDEMRQLTKELHELKDLLTKRGGGDDSMAIFSTDLILENIKKNARELIDNQRLKNLINTNSQMMRDYEEENQHRITSSSTNGQHSIDNEIKEENEEEDDESIILKIDNDDDDDDQTPIDFTVKKEKV